MEMTRATSVKKSMKAPLAIGRDGVVTNASPGRYAQAVDLSSLSINPSPNSSIQYSKKYLEELKAETPSRLPARPSTLANEFDIEGAVVDNLDELDLLTGHQDENAAPETVIHTESYITDLKSRRKQAGAAKFTPGEDDFISLSGTVARASDLTFADVDLGPHPSSRLMREDDEVGDAEEGEPLDNVILCWGPYTYVVMKKWPSLPVLPSVWPSGRRAGKRQPRKENPI